MDVDLLNYYSQIEVDKTIAVFKDTLTIPANGTNQKDYVLPTGAGRTFWEGTYTLSGSTQQNDINGMEYSGLTGVGIEARSYVGGIRILGVNNTGSSVTASYNLSVIASPETGIIPSAGSFPSFSDGFAFDSRDDHRKLVLTRGLRAGDADDWGAFGYKVVLRGDADILSNTKRVKVYISGEDGLLYDASTHYGRTMLTVYNTEVIAVINPNIRDSNVDLTVYVRYFYE